MAETGVMLEDVRVIASQLPRSYEVFVRGRVKFRVGQIVWLAFSRDQTEIGFSFPKELRQALVDSDPDTYFLSGSSDLRFNWVCARLAALERHELRRLGDDLSVRLPRRQDSTPTAHQSTPRMRPSTSPGCWKGCGPPIRREGRRRAAAAVRSARATG